MVVAEAIGRRLLPVRHAIVPNYAGDAQSVVTKHACSSHRLGDAVLQFSCSHIIPAIFFTLAMSAGPERNPASEARLMAAAPAGNRITPRRGSYNARPIGTLSPTYVSFVWISRGSGFLGFQEQLLPAGRFWPALFEACVNSFHEVFRRPRTGVRAV